MSNSVAKRPQAVKWCFTINNYDDSELDASSSLSELHPLFEQSDYLIYGKEVAPETGTPHLQGYVVLKKKKYLTGMKKLHATAHWEIARGSHKQASDYCKKDKDFLEYGTLPDDPHLLGGIATKGKYELAIELAKAGRIDEIDAELRTKHLRTYKDIQKEYYKPAKPDKLSEPSGVWLHGPAGTGKTTYAEQAYPDAYYKLPTKWWCNYDQEEYVIIEDISPRHAESMADYLKVWMDQPSFPIEAKGVGLRPIRPKKIIITSQYPIRKVFPDIETYEAIFRRCEVFEFTELHVPPVQTSRFGVEIIPEDERM